MPYRASSSRFLRICHALALLALFGGCPDPSYDTEAGDGAPRPASDAGAAAPLADGGSALVGADAADSVPAGSDAGAAQTWQTAEGGAARLEDASTAAQAPDADAAQPLAEVLPDWAKPLLGRYATRAFSFKQDDFPTVTRALDVYLTQFSFDERTGVTLRSKLCQSSAQSNLATLRLVDPTQVPERVEHVLFSELEQRWHSEGPGNTVGYMREPPAPCAGKLGQSVPKLSAQIWIDGDSCRCTPASADPVVNDCRLLDPDADGQPGFSFTLRGNAPPLGDTTIYAASESSTHYVNGQVSSDGKQHDANVLGGERPFQLGCNPAGCADIGKLATYCPVSFNPARFVRVDEGASCQSILDNLDTLFPGPPPPIAARCY